MALTDDEKLRDAGAIASRNKTNAAYGPTTATVEQERQPFADGTTFEGDYTAPEPS